MEKTKLLVSGLGGSLFPYLHEKLKENFIVYYLDANHELANIYPCYNFITAPFVSDIEYAELAINLINSKKIDYYVPLIDEEILLAIKVIASNTNVKVITPSSDFTELSLNKFNLMQLLAKEDISKIPSYMGDTFTNEIEYPLFAKPVSGRGSRGIRRINSADKLAAYYELEEYPKQNVLIQPLIEGTEYTVGVLVNNLNKIISISSKKVISKKGITQSAITEDNEYIDKVVKEVVYKLKPHGPINIQLFLTPENEVKIFEINPRFSTTSIMEYEGGIDLITEYIKNYNVEFIENIKRPTAGLKLFRRWENIFYNA